MKTLLLLTLALASIQAHATESQPAKSSRIVLEDGTYRCGLLCNTYVEANAQEVVMAGGGGATLFSRAPGKANVFANSEIECGIKVITPTSFLFKCANDSKLFRK